jgi:hypothetical protein
MTVRAMLGKPMEDKLHRMKELETIIDEHGEEDPRMNAVFEESRTLRAELVPIFLPLVQKLADAGLLSCTMDLEGFEDAPRVTNYRSLDAHPTEAFDNGNIWLSCSWDGEGYLAKEECRAFAALASGKMQGPRP